MFSSAGRQGRDPRADRRLGPGRPRRASSCSAPTRAASPHVRVARLTGLAPGRLGGLPVRCAPPWAATSSTSPRRSTTRTTCPTSGTRTTPSARDFIARYHRLRGEDGLPSDRDRRARAQGAAGRRGERRERQGVGRPARAEVARGLGAARHRLRRLHPHHRAAAPRGRGQDPQRRPRQRPRRHLPRPLRGPVLRPLRGVLHGVRAPRGEPLPDPRAARSSSSARTTTSSGSRRTRTGCSSTTSSTPRRSSRRSAATRCCR